jgi:glutamate N-acetyltransferase/amino-acid N-acetyltransferase
MNLPLGFRYAAAYAGLRKAAKDDLALIAADAPASAAAVFTTNRVAAAPVEVARANLRATKGRARAWIVNAGNANCATRTGASVAKACVRAAARALDAKPAEILPASTGVIGVEMDSSKVTRALPSLAESLTEDGFERAACAIMTTDTRPKIAEAGIKSVCFAGMAKGSGMIHPRMATTLGFVMTDAAASPSELRTALKRSIATSFNRLSVDGDMSTNDTVGVLASGASGHHLAAKDLEGALTEVLQSLAIQIAADGEGARKLVTIDVQGASSDAAAEKIARAIANSPLVKTAIAGADPNWGRIICAAGYSGAVFEPRKVDIEMQGVRVCRGGLAADFSEAGLTEKLRERECVILFSIRGSGKGKARFWTCDLTEGYIEINGSYRT